VPDAQSSLASGREAREVVGYVATVAVPLLVGLAVGVVVLLATNQSKHHEYWPWQVGAVVAATAALSVVSWVSDQRRTTRNLNLADGTDKTAHVEALLQRGLVVPAEERGAAERVAGAQVQKRWTRVVLPVLAMYGLGSAWTNEGSSFWLALALPALLLPTWARDLGRRRTILQTAAAQRIVARPPVRTPIPWRP